MNKFMALTGAFALMATPLSIANATTTGTTLEDAQSIHNLNVMLMVTSLRCRGTAYNFQNEYDVFLTNHMSTINEAADTLREHFEPNDGDETKKRAVDRMGIRMANKYGAGHPWLDCEGLKNATIELSTVENTSDLADAARELTASQKPQAEITPG